jgi:oligosaccharide repeat unit polymerase
MLNFSKLTELAEQFPKTNLIQLMIFSILSLIAVLALINLGFSNLLAISFFLNLFILLILYFYTTNKNYPLSLTNCTILVFSLAFFVCAPITQLINSEYDELINTLPISDNQLIQCNLLISIFLIFYIIFRIHIKNQFKLNFSYLSTRKYSEKKIFLLMLCVIIPFVPINAKELFNFFNGLGSYNSAMYPSLTVLILVKYVYFLPIFFTALILSQHFKYSHLPLIIASLLICLFFKNQFIENRSGFGTAFLLLFMVIAKKYLNSNRKIIVFFLIVIFILFPIGEIISLYRNLHIPSYDKFFNAFNSVHYDSWANGAGIIDFVNKTDYQYGKQLLGSIFFWVPRSLWESKSIASGQLLGIYLVENYHHWMINIASPIMFEGYIDFGYVGVVLFALLLAIASEILDRMYSSNNTELFILASYISISYFFILRGPLLSSLAYTIGNSVAIITGIWLVNKFCLYKDKNEHL